MMHELIEKKNFFQKVASEGSDRINWGKYYYNIIKLYYQVSVLQSGVPEPRQFSVDDLVPRLLQ